MRQRLITVVLVIGALAGLMFFNSRAREVAAQGPSPPGEAGKRWGDPAELAARNAGKTATLTLAIDGESLGDVVIEFYPNEAPNTVENFIRLARKGFYDGLLFHRVIPKFMIQGGDPEGDGRGGPGYEIPAEFNDHKHVPGAVAMARTQDPNSAGSQFYICLGTPSWLDGSYTVFGQVISGQEHVDAVGKQPTGANDRPTTRVTMAKVTISD